MKASWDVGASLEFHGSLEGRWSLVGDSWEPHRRFVGASLEIRGSLAGDLWELRGRLVERGSLMWRGSLVGDSWDVGALWDVGVSWASMAKPILVTSVKNHVSICNSGKFGDNLQHVGRPRHIVCKRAHAC